MTGESLSIFIFNSTFTASALGVLFAGIHTRLITTAGEVIQRNFVKVSQTDEQVEGDCLVTAFVTAIDGLCDSEMVGDLGLGQIGVFSQVADTPEMHDRLLLFAGVHVYYAKIFLYIYEKVSKNTKIYTV